jgi:phenylalanyl-tRNA synthetase alpha subunit
MSLTPLNTHIECSEQNMGKTISTMQGLEKANVSVPKEKYRNEFLNKLTDIQLHQMELLVIQEIEHINTSLKLSAMRYKNDKDLELKEMQENYTNAPLPRLMDSLKEKYDLLVDIIDELKYRHIP